MKVSSLKNGVKWIVALGVVCVFGTGGCSKGGNHTAVRGEVTLDGKPLEQGSILFMPIKGTRGVATGTGIRHGRYEISNTTGPAVGWNRVQIQAMRGTGTMVPSPLAPPGRMIEMETAAVAPRFNSASILKFEIKPGDNSANFDVQSE